MLLLLVYYLKVAFDTLIILDTQIKNVQYLRDVNGIKDKILNLYLSRRMVKEGGRRGGMGLAGMVERGVVGLVLKNGEG